MLDLKFMNKHDPQLLINNNMLIHFHVCRIFQVFLYILVLGENPPTLHKNPSAGLFSSWRFPAGSTFCSCSQRSARRSADRTVTGSLSVTLFTCSGLLGGDIEPQISLSAFVSVWVYCGVKAPRDIKASVHWYGQTSFPPNESGARWCEVRRVWLRPTLKSCFRMDLDVFVLLRVRLFPLFFCLLPSVGMLCTWVGVISPCMLLKGIQGCGSIQPLPTSAPPTSRLPSPAHYGNQRDHITAHP